jgi:hypothetical protein
MVLKSLMTDTLSHCTTNRAKVCSPMREEHPPTNQRMRLVPSHLFEPLQQCVVDPFRAKLENELIVVNRGLFSVLIHRSLYIPRRDHLLVGLGLWGIGDCFRAIDDLRIRTSGGELRNEICLRGKGRRRERGSDGVDNVRWSWDLRHVLGRVNCRPIFKSRSKT